MADTPAKPSFFDSNWFGLGDQSGAQPFARPAPPVTLSDLEKAAPAPPAATAQTAGRTGVRPANTDPLRAAVNDLARAGTPPTQEQINEVNQRFGKDGKPLISHEAPGMVSNYIDALKRGHTGTVLATGGAALLAGVLAYNMLKKKSK